MGTMKASDLAIYWTAAVWMGIGIERAAPGGPIPWWVWIIGACAVVATTRFARWSVDRRRLP